jgi:hypothetical protein
VALRCALNQSSWELSGTLAGGAITPLSSKTDRSSAVAPATAKLTPTAVVEELELEER